MASRGGYGYPWGKGCYLRDPNHPYLTKECTVCRPDGLRLPRVRVAVRKGRTSASRHLRNDEAGWGIPHWGGIESKA